MSSAQERWIEAHPYLRKVAEFQQALTDAFAELTPPVVAMPDWKDIFEGYAEGVPLLEGLPAELGYSAAAGEVLLAGSAELLKRSLPERVEESARALLDHLQEERKNCAAAIEWAQNGGPECVPAHTAGLLRLLAWAAIRRTLAPVLGSYAELRKDDGWMRGYCPVCGALPPLAQVAGAQPRVLACCYCRASWVFRRIGCPFCGNDDQEQLSILTIEQEPLFRLDTCRACNGYLKTYLGSDDLDLHLCDWPSLHLDMLAREHKLERKGASLFEIS
jgi:FdhE protein